MPWKRDRDNEKLSNINAGLRLMLLNQLLAMVQTPSCSSFLRPVYDALLAEVGTQLTFAPSSISLERVKSEYMTYHVRRYGEAEKHEVENTPASTSVPYYATAHAEVLRLSQRANVLKVFSVLATQPMLAKYFNRTTTSTIKSIMIKSLPETPNIFAMFLMTKPGDDIGSSSLVSLTEPVDVSSQDWVGFLEGVFSEWDRKGIENLQVHIEAAGAMVLLGESDDLIAVLDDFFTDQKNNSDYSYMKKDLFETMRGYLQEQDNAMSNQSSSNEFEMTALKYPRWKRNTALEQISQKNMEALLTHIPESFDSIRQVVKIPTTAMAYLQEQQQAFQMGRLKGATILASFEAYNMPRCPVVVVTLTHRPNHLSKPFQLILCCQGNSEAQCVQQLLIKQGNTQDSQQFQGQLTFDVSPQDPKIILDVIAILAHYSKDTAYLQETLTSLLQNPQSNSLGDGSSDERLVTLVNNSIKNELQVCAANLSVLSLRKSAVTVEKDEEASTSTPGMSP